MKGFLLDTNIPSEMTRPRPQSSVSGWLDDAEDDQLYFSVVSIGEILKGITLLPESKRRGELRLWLDETLRPWFQGRILPVNEPIAERWGVLAGQHAKVDGKAPERSLTVSSRRLRSNTTLTVVTRNVRDLAGLGVTVFNPWDV